MQTNNDTVSRQELKRAIYIINELIDKKNPFTLENLPETDIINNEKLNLCLKYVNNILENLIQNNSIKLFPFTITSQQKALVKFPTYDIGISEFVGYVNNVIDTEKYKKLSPIDLNRGLKQMKILHEIQNPKTGKNRTIINPDAAIKYGITTKKYEVNGITIEKIVYTEAGKKFLLDNLEEILQKSKEYGKI